jgi:AbrB family looped-hinge helix DNA binding protein
METVTISLKFQVVIQQAIRESLGLRSGEKVQMVCFRNLIEITPLREIRSLRGFLKAINTAFDR